MVLTFKNFISSKKSAGWLAAAFAYCYEKPGYSDNVLASYEINKGFTSAAEAKLYLCTSRAERGEYWYTFLSGLSLSALDTSLFVDTFKLDYSTSIMAQFSFLVRNAEKASYCYYKYSDKIKITKEIPITPITSNFASFELTDLEPNMEYAIELTVNGANGTEYKKELSFRTLQSYPESIGNIKLTPNDNLMPYDKHNLEVSPKSLDFGYWKRNGYGYIIQLIVNGALKKEIETSSPPSNFKISEYFNYKNKIKTGDVIQIGIRTWVKYNGKKLFDSAFVKTSNTVRMLKKPIIAYLNKDRIS